MTFFNDLVMTTKDLTCQQSHISPKTAILEKMFNMCLPATSITLRK